jgi:small subunit ribosomal protein S7
MRRKYKSHEVKPDRLYNSVDVQRIINHVMLAGKKCSAEKIVYGAMSGGANIVKLPPLTFFKAACKNAMPDVNIFSKRVGSATYTIPKLIQPETKIKIAIRWISKTAKQSKKGTDMETSLKRELVNAYKRTGKAVRMRDELHDRARSNYHAGSFFRDREKTKKEGGVAS